MKKSVLGLLLVLMILSAGLVVSCEQNPDPVVRKVTLVTNGGTIDEGADVLEYTEGTTTPLPDGEKIHKTDHNFDGWFVDEDFSGSAVTEITASDKGDKTFYAKWSEDKSNRYYVEFFGNGSTSGTMEKQEFIFDVAQNLSPNGFSKTGYSFAGWATTADGYPVYKDKDSFINQNKDATVSLYARWDTNIYSVEFNGNGATSGTMEKQDIVYDDNRDLYPNTFSKQGHEFIGWATSPEGEVEYEDKENVINLIDEGSITLYAKWERIGPLSFEFLAAGSLSITRNYIVPLYYSLNGGEKILLNGTTIEANAGDIISLFADRSTSDGLKISCTSDCYVYGNIMSLVDMEDYVSADTLFPSAFQGLFHGNSHIKTHETKKLILPATKLANFCYAGMFCNSSITKAPDLPATTLAIFCYYSMFESCGWLTEAPEILPATTLAENCYLGMFHQCANLTKAPILPAAKLAPLCYKGMFQGCIKLKSITCLATDIGTSANLENWVAGVPAGGTFTKSSSMKNWVTGFSGIPGGWRVQDYKE